MAHLVRLIDWWVRVVLVFGLLAFAAVTAAFASVPKVVPVTWHYSGHDASTPEGAVQAACSANGWVCTVSCSISDLSASCSGTMAAADGSWSNGASFFPAGTSSGVGVCPAGTTENSAGTCDCPSGHDDGTTCRETTDADCPAAGTDLGGADNVFPRQAGGGSCVGGCVIRGSGSVTGTGGVAGSYSYGPYTSTGKACSTSSITSPAGTDAAACVKSGGYPGELNGVVTCIPATSSSTSKTTATTSTSASGVASGSTTTSETIDNKDGSTTTVTTTTRSDGSTRTTTTTAPSGSGAGAGGSDQSGDTCKLHPDLAMCKQSSFSGSCSSSFVCDGDAVQCAIAKEQHSRNCGFYDPASVPGPLADDSQRFTNARSDGDSPAWSPTNVANVTNQAIDFESGISQAKHFGSQCVQDEALVLTALNKVVIIHWSDWCPQMQMIGKLVLSVAFLVCVGIVFKA